MEKTVKYVFALIAAFLLYSCASIGQPTGGAQDMLPPVFVKSNPPKNALKVTKNKMEIEFDEIIQLKDQNDKVVVSPVQKEMAIIKAQGRKVTIEFRDSMLPATTYSIDFADAIQDNNEGNPIDGFSYAFSTGDTIDSLQISGMVLDSRSLEPQQKKLVGIHSNLNDTAFYKIPLLRVARTNELGQFTIRNLKPGKYHLFAIDDVDRDYKFANPGENIAFYSDVIIPTAESYLKTDTILTLDRKIDTIIDAYHSRYFPNDILLSMFNEEKAAQYLVKDERLDSQKLYLQFATRADTLPKIELLNYKPEKSWYLVDHSKTNDTITYWITDKKLMKMDSIHIAASFLRTDTTNNLVMGTDTLLFKMKKAKPVKKPKKKEGEDSIPQIVFMQFQPVSSASQDVHLPVYFKAEIPIDTILKDKIHLEIKEDTLWTQGPPITLKRNDSLSLLRYNVDYDWSPGTGYKIVIDSAAIFDINGLYNKKIEHSFEVKQMEEYSKLSFSIDVRDSAYVELLGTDDKPIRIEPVVNNVAEFSFLNPGTYYARLFIDRNGNGKYDTGDYALKRQPEDTYYYPKKLTLKKNWDINENWILNATPVDQQKHVDIKKNKPAAKKWEKHDEDQKKKGTEEETEEDAFGKNQFQNGENVFGPKRNY